MVAGGSSGTCRALGEAGPGSPAFGWAGLGRKITAQEGPCLCRERARTRPPVQGASRPSSLVPWDSETSFVELTTHYPDWPPPVSLSSPKIPSDGGGISPFLWARQLIVWP